MIDVDGWYYRARRLICYAEKEFWHATPRRVIAEFKAYCEWHGISTGKSQQPDDGMTFEEIMGVD
jgi:hypothetical protein